MKATVSTSVTISATPADVFEYLAHLKYHYLWNPQIRKFSTQDSLSIGKKYTTESQVLGATIKATNEVTTFDPPHKLVLENFMGVVKYRATFRLSGNVKETRVVLTTQLSTNGAIYIFTKPVLKQLALRELRTDLQALKIAVENKLK